MDLIKDNKENSRQVWKFPDFYRKTWQCKPEHNPDEAALEEHLDILEKLMPGFVITHGVTTESLYIDYKIIPGIPANTFPITEQFIDKIYNFCINHINYTSPYAHGDWQLSNILIDGNNIQIVDWDNVGIYSPQEIIEKLHSDLKSSFGDKFTPPGMPQ